MSIDTSTDLLEIEYIDTRNVQEYIRRQFFGDDCIDRVPSPPE